MVSFYFRVSPSLDFFYLLQWQSRFFLFPFLTFFLLFMFCSFLLSPIRLHHPSYSSYPTIVPPRKQNPDLNIKPQNRENHKIILNIVRCILTTKHQTTKSRKQKHWFEHISTKKTQNPPKKHQTTTIVTTNLNMKARKAKSILFGGLHWVCTRESANHYPLHF